MASVRGKVKRMAKATHPQQPLVRDEKGVIRFKVNAVVRELLDRAERGEKTDLNWIWGQCRYSTEDLEQFYQLIGYSVSGFGEIDGFRKAKVAEYDRQADEMRAQRRR